MEEGANKRIEIFLNHYLGGVKTEKTKNLHFMINILQFLTPWSNASPPQCYKPSYVCDYVYTIVLHPKATVTIQTYNNNNNNTYYLTLIKALPLPLTHTLAFNLFL